MAIQLVGYVTSTVQSLSYSVDVTTLTGGISSSIAPGDLIVVATGFSSVGDGNPGVSSPTMTEVADLYANDTIDTNLSVSWMIAGSTPPTSITMSGTLGSSYGNCAVISVWRGVDTSTPLDVTVTTATGTSSANANPPAITPATNGATILAIAMCGVSSPTYFTGPTGFTTVANAASTGSTSSSTIGVAYLSGQSASVSVDPDTMTHFFYGGSTASWASVTMALRPGSTAATATLGATEGVDTASFGLSARHTAALGATEAADTASFALSARHTAALAATEASDAASVAVSARHTAVLDTGETSDTMSIALAAETEVYLNATEDTDAASFALTATHTATVSATEPADVVVIAATIVGLSQIALASTEAVDTAAVAVSLTAIATAALAATETRDTAAAAATVLNVVTASLAATEARDVGAFTTSLAGLSSASLAATEAGDTAAFAAARFDVLTASLAATEARDTAAFTYVDPVQIAAAGYAAKRRRKATMPQLPKPPRVEVVIDEAVLRQIEEERLAALNLERKKEALRRVAELRQGYTPQPVRTVKLEVKEPPEKMQAPLRTVTLARPPRPAPQQAPIRGSIALSVIRPAPPVEVRQPVFVSLRRAANRQAHSG